MEEAPPITGTGAGVTVSKRQRKPSVRLGDLGYPPRRPAAADSKRSKRSSSPSAAGSGASQNNHVPLPRGGSRRPKALPAVPLPDDLDINNRNEDPNLMAILRVSDSEEPSHTNLSEEETKSEPSDQNRVESQNQYMNQNQNQNGRSGLSQQGGVHGWLDRLRLGRYKPVFDIHEVDLTVLPLLTLEDLKDMGINAVGSRRKLYCAIQELNK